MKHFIWNSVMLEKKFCRIKAVHSSWFVFCSFINLMRVYPYRLVNIDHRSESRENWSSISVWQKRCARFYVFTSMPPPNVESYHLYIALSRSYTEFCNVRGKKKKSITLHGLLWLVAGTDLL